MRARYAASVSFAPICVSGSLPITAHDDLTARTTAKIQAPHQAPRRTPRSAVLSLGPRALFARSCAHAAPRVIAPRVSQNTRPPHARMYGGFFVFAREKQARVQHSNCPAVLYIYIKKKLAEISTISGDRSCDTRGTGADTGAVLATWWADRRYRLRFARAFRGLSTTARRRENATNS